MFQRPLKALLKPFKTSSKGLLTIFEHSDNVFKRSLKEFASTFKGLQEAFKRPFKGL